MGCKKCAEEVCGCSTMDAEWESFEDSFVTKGHEKIIKKFQGIPYQISYKWELWIYGEYLNEFSDDEVKRIINENIQSCIDSLDLEEDWMEKEDFEPKYELKDVDNDEMAGYTLSFDFKAYRSLTKNADSQSESLVEQPDFIPNGDGRAIGQQDFAINLSPLHAESSNPYVKDWLFLGVKEAKDNEDARNLNCTHCNPKGDNISRHKVVELRAMKPTSMKLRNGDTAKFKRGDHITLGMACAQNKLTFNTDTVGTPSPTFDEGITGQDGPSDSPTNSTFEARDMHKAPNNNDVQKARGALIRNGYAKDKSSILYDKYMVNQQYNDKGKKQNRFYYTAVTENDGRYYAMGAHGGIGASHITPYNIYGKKESPRMHFGEAAPALRMVKEKEQAKLNRRPSWKQYRVVTYSELAAESLSEIEGPTAEATSGGLHSPSSFDMTWEDGSGQSSASIPPNEIAWAEGKSTTWLPWAIGIAVAGMGGLLLSMKGKEQKAENNLKSVVKARKGCCGGKRADTVRKDSEFSVGQINPVEVEGQNDIYGAEELHSPQTSAKVSQPNWGPQTTYLQNQRSTQKMW